MNVNSLNYNNMISSQFSDNNYNFNSYNNMMNPEENVDKNIAIEEA